MKIHISAVILIFDICCRNPDWLSIIYFPKSKPKTWGGNPAMGEDLLYSRLSPWGKSYYIASFPGGKATMGENCYTTPAATSHSGIRTEDARITRSVSLRSNHYVKYTDVYKICKTDPQKCLKYWMIFRCVQNILCVLVVFFKLACYMIICFHMLQYYLIPDADHKKKTQN
jgi:hypothetical protein